MKRSNAQQPVFFATLAHEFPKVPPHFIAHIGQGLIHAARRQNRIACALCNGEINQDSYDRRHRSIEKLVSVLVRDLPKFKGVIYQGDPRGAAIKLVLPSGNCSNDFGREGYCVPEGR